MNVYGDISPYTETVVALSVFDEEGRKIIQRREYMIDDLT